MIVSRIDLPCECLIQVHAERHHCPWLEPWIPVINSNCTCCLLFESRCKDHDYSWCYSWWDCRGRTWNVTVIMLIARKLFVWQPPGFPCSCCWVLLKLIFFRALVKQQGVMAQGAWKNRNYFHSNCCRWINCFFFHLFMYHEAFPGTEVEYITVNFVFMIDPFVIIIFIWWLWLRHC